MYKILLTSFAIFVIACSKPSKDLKAFLGTDITLKKFSGFYRCSAAGGDRDYIELSLLKGKVTYVKESTTSDEFEEKTSLNGVYKIINKDTLIINLEGGEKIKTSSLNSEISEKEIIAPFQLTLIYHPDLEGLLDSEVKEVMNSQEFKLNREKCQYVTLFNCEQMSELGRQIDISTIGYFCK
ncbi:hypothetical protein [Leptospira neocaledonica]|uniref:Lipoprotein n=1 Tax=Leptospira neocaledonica TaxID=2023192 RepID=A0A2M9ZW57_9LEPT|nr:hypothetical protein [Leptospira neocaledonica]PJZ76308.1 hypothetical protein CH365_13010 [Leptospira neocaledonica]